MYCLDYLLEQMFRQGICKRNPGKYGFGTVIAAHGTHP